MTMDDDALLSDDQDDAIIQNATSRGGCARVVLFVLTSPYLFLRWLWRRPDTTVRKVRDLFVIAGVVLIAVNTISTHYIAQATNERGKENKTLIVNTHDLVTRINAQTSPAAQARQQAAIDAIILRVDCNTRRDFQDAIRQLVQLGIPQASSINILTAQCAAIEKQHAGGGG